MKTILATEGRILVIMLLLAATGCISQKRLEYLQGDNIATSAYPVANLDKEVIQPGDELFIRVSSFDDVQFNFFSSQSENRQMNFSNDVSVSLISYDVNDSGYVNFPLLGYVPVANLTIEEATEKLRVMLADYTNQPTVLIEIVNKRISIVGEVARPGHYVFTKNRLMLLEALSMAGDITVFGNKKRVYILREENNELKKIPVDLTSESLMATEEFFVRQNDVIYVPPTQSRTWSIESIPWNLMLTTISTLVLILSYLNVN
ncbi:MAG: polysaccharide biosynthesis/export family protein [Bacteroidales bacterium]|nr:polysaccharide biosynthesis/export family protein [Bacteroidales bacterium]